MEKKFVEKSAEEIAAMDNSGKASYFQEKLNHDNAELKKLIESKASPEEIAAVKAEVIELHNQRLDEMLEAQKQQGLALQRMAQGMPRIEQKQSFRDLLHAKQAHLKAMHTGKKRDWIELSSKEVGDITIANSITGQIPQAQRLPGLDELPLRPPEFINSLNRSPIGKTLVEWEYQVDRDGSPAATAEGATKPQIDSSYAVGSESVAKYTDRIRVSMEALDDIDWMNNEIRGELADRLLLQVEQDAYNGSGTATPQNLRGVRTVATAFSAPTAMAGAIDEADNVDVFNAAYTQIKNAFLPQPTHIFLSNGDLALMESLKVGASDRRRVQSVFEIAVSQRYKGAQIVGSALIEDGDFLIGHMPYATLYDYMAPTIKIGFDGNDFSQNMVTLIAEWRGMVVVKNNRRPAIIAGALDTAKAALETT